MVGIVDVGVYVPRYRLTGELLSAQWGGGAKGSRSVANWDEDALTMAWEAAHACMGADRSGDIDGLFLASVSMPYTEKSNAAFLATALDLRHNIFLAEMSGSLSSGIAAIRAARDAVMAGGARNALVAASEIRLAEPSDPMERNLGDAAAAVIVGENAIADIIDMRSHVQEYFDVWRKREDEYLKSADAKFVQDTGYSVFQAEVARAILDANGLKISEIDHAVIYSPDARSVKLIARSIGIDAERCVTPVTSIGDLGSAAPIFGLAAVLEKAKPGEIVLVTAHSSGADAILLRVTDGISGWKSRVNVDEEISRGAPVPSYGKYLQFRGVIPSEQVDPWTSPAVLLREEKENWRLIARKCDSCGAIQYPARRICWNCSARDRMSDCKLGETGVVYTFTKDHLPPNPHPPTIMVSVDVDGGGRFYTQLTDCDPAKVEVGMRVKFTMRRLHSGGGFHNYFWKFRPVEVG